jgi:hypothetical protein
MKILTVTIADSGDFNISVVKTTHYYVSGYFIAKEMRD